MTGRLQFEGFVAGEKRFTRTIPPTPEAIEDTTRLFGIALLLLLEMQPGAVVELYVTPISSRVNETPVADATATGA